jgi:hypothetical protein
MKGIINIKKVNDNLLDSNFLQKLNKDKKQKNKINFNIKSIR